MTREIKLTPEQAVVMQALQRIDAAISLEANQLASVWGHKVVSGDLARLVERVRQVGENFIQDAQRVIQVAQSIPDVSHRSP